MKNACVKFGLSVESPFWCGFLSSAMLVSSIAAFPIIFNSLSIVWSHPTTPPGHHKCVDHLTNALLHKLLFFRL